MIRTENLSKNYGASTALHDLNLSVESGQIYCLLGANGAGKSTSIKLLLNFIQPTSGHAFINEHNVTTDAMEVRRITAYLPEQVTLYPELTGLENVRYFAALAGSCALSDDALLSLMQESGIEPDDARRPLGSYSKGMQQKAGLAIAWAKNAQVLLLDEPTSGLDPEASHEFSRILAKSAARGVAVLMATHDIFRAVETGHIAGIMRKGRLLREINTSDISHSELESVYLELMRSSP